MLVMSVIDLVDDIDLHLIEPSVKRCGDVDSFRSSDKLEYNVA
jgi:hypothetical protein